MGERYIMGIEDTEKPKQAKKRLTLTDLKSVRAALCKMARQYHNGEIPDSKIRNLTYVLNSILGADKLINVETELTSKFEQLERLVSGQGGTVIDPKQIDNPYAQDLKRQLENERKISADLQATLLDMKRQLAGIGADTTDVECVGNF
jgi:hypothetical protein